MNHLGRPSPAYLARLLARLPQAPLTYPEVGATRGQLPGGYDHLRRRARLGSGPASFERAATAVCGWQLQRLAGLLLVASAPGAAVDADLIVGIPLGAVWVLAPGRVVWTVAEPRRRGFAYGTLPGHPECGEESFVVEHGDDDAVRLTVTAFSRPSSWPVRLAKPLARWQQRRVTDAYMRALPRA